MDGNSPDGGEGGQKPHGVLGRKPEYVLAFADHNESLKKKVLNMRSWKNIWYLFRKYLVPI